MHIRTRMALQIIALAAMGERDPGYLRAFALKKLTRPCGHQGVTIAPQTAGAEKAEANGEAPEADEPGSLARE
jgi:hypothetical protein